MVTPAILNNFLTCCFKTCILVRSSVGVRQKVLIAKFKLNVILSILRFSSKMNSWAKVSYNWKMSFKEEEE